MYYIFCGPERRMHGPETPGPEWQGPECHETCQFRNIYIFKKVNIFRREHKCNCQEGLFLSTVSEKSLENINLPFNSPKERCVEYLNSNLNEFLQKLERQTLNKVRISNNRIFKSINNGVSLSYLFINS